MVEQLSFEEILEVAPAAPVVEQVTEPVMSASPDVKPERKQRFNLPAFSNNDASGVRAHLLKTGAIKAFYESEYVRDMQTFVDCFWNDANKKNTAIGFWPTGIMTIIRSGNEFFSQSFIDIERFATKGWTSNKQLVALLYEFGKEPEFRRIFNKKYGKKLSSALCKHAKSSGTEGDALETIFSYWAKDINLA